MTLRYKLALLAAIVAGAVIGGCSSSAGVVNPSAQAPGARQGALSPAGQWGGATSRSNCSPGRQSKKSFEMFEDHNKTNRAEPYNDPVCKTRSSRFR